MKIVQINETCGTGSIGRTTSEFAEACSKLGHDSYVFYASGTPAYKKSYQIGKILQKHSQIDIVCMQISQMNNIRLNLI